MITNLYQEICCDECNETIHNHFDCPVCKTSRGIGYQGTDQYCYLDNYVLVIRCEDCDTLFEKVNDSDRWYDEDLEIRKFANVFDVI
jgi:hypothetical protein